METFNQDPKPGRLVLPLVLVGMIATTYTFVNRVATNNDLDLSVVEEEVEDENIKLERKIRELESKVISLEEENAHLKVDTRVSSEDVESIVKNILNIKECNE